TAGPDSRWTPDRLADLVRPGFRGTGRTVAAPPAFLAAVGGDLRGPVVPRRGDDHGGAGAGLALRFPLHGDRVRRDDAGLARHDRGVESAVRHRDGGPRTVREPDR